LLTYFGLTYDEKVDPVKYDGIKADNVTKILAEFLQAGEIVKKRRRKETGLYMGKCL